MTARQVALLEYHRDLAAFGTNAKNPVFVILDLDDSVGFEIASFYQKDVCDKRDAIKSTGAFPAFTLALSIPAANSLLKHGWPNAKPIVDVPPNRVPVLLISEGRCVVVLIRRE